jgi:hypothetical protein
MNENKKDARNRRPGVPNWSRESAAYRAERLLGHLCNRKDNAMRRKRIEQTIGSQGRRRGANPTYLGAALTLITLIGAGVRLIAQEAENRDAELEIRRVETVESKTRRVEADLRSLAVGIESYFVDHNVYPAHAFDANLIVDAAARKSCPDLDWSPPTFRRSVANGAGRDVFSITTPVAYLLGYFSDPFAPQEKQCSRTYAYYSVNKKEHSGWISWGAGPDGDYDLDWRKYGGIGEFNQEGVDLRFIDVVYDPTNGSVSNGDIVRWKQ